MNATGGKHWFGGKKVRGEAKIIKCLLYIPAEEESAIKFTQCRGEIVSISFLPFSPSSNLPAMLLFSGGERTWAPSSSSSPGGRCGCKQRRRRKGALLAAQTFIRRGREKKGFCRRSNTERERKRGLFPFQLRLFRRLCAVMCAPPTFSPFRQPPTPSPLSPPHTRAKTFRSTTKVRQSGCKRPLLHRSYSRKCD